MDHWRDLYAGMAAAMNTIRNHVGLPPLEAVDLAVSGVPTPNGQAAEVCRAIDAISGRPPSEGFAFPAPQSVPAPAPAPTEN